MELMERGQSRSCRFKNTSLQRGAPIFREALLFIGSASYFYGECTHLYTKRPHSSRNVEYIEQHVPALRQSKYARPSSICPLSYLYAPTMISESRFPFTSPAEATDQRNYALADGIALLLSRLGRWMQTSQARKPAADKTQRMLFAFS